MNAAAKASRSADTEAALEEKFRRENRNRKGEKP